MLHWSWNVILAASLLTLCVSLAAESGCRTPCPAMPWILPVDQ